MLLTSVSLASFNSKAAASIAAIFSSKFFTSSAPFNSNTVFNRSKDFCTSVAGSLISKSLYAFSAVSMAVLRAFFSASN